MISNSEKFKRLFNELSEIINPSDGNIKAAEILVHLLHECAYEIVINNPHMACCYGDDLMKADNMLQNLYHKKLDLNG